MKKTVRILLVAALVFSIVSLSLFMVLNTHHDHQGEYCPVCVRLETAAGILRGIFTLCIALLLCGSVVLRTVRSLRAAQYAGKAFFNPVVLGVRLNN